MITAGISFLGSVQLGPVNMVIIQNVLEGRRKGALLIGAGVCIPEFIYASVAIIASTWLLQHQTLLEILEWGVVPLLVGMGVFSFFRKKTLVNDDTTPKQKTANLMKGMFISFLNPQMLPYWLMILVMLNGYAFFRMNNMADMICFVAGTGIGEFILISVLVAVTWKFREFFLEKLKRWSLNKIFGVLFFLLAALQSLKLFFQFRK